MNRILIVEDQVIVRQGLRMIIEQDGAFSVAGEAENGQEAIEKMESHGADIILMDIQMPVMNGIEATRMIKKRWPAVKILILTTFNDEDYALQTLREGTNGFLLKTSDGPRLLQSIRSCLEGGISIHEQVAAKVMPKLLDHSCHEEAEVPLTPRERDIARLIGHGKTNKEIANELYLSVGTVKNHLTQILQKLDLRDRTQLAIFAVKNDIL
ncbi:MULTISPECIES: response regulator transcription factor [Bacillaceae]|uniref:response regulator transcription factor n=1 Tax=Bacillaceae TaxID=186817 RepID=UPI000B9BF4AC|nr:response regulator transcription factor [Bacillus infantis]OXT17414.1 DNA-binding response regulator [Bacillus sp. OG2]MCK6204313.1 response regulator transcription factor [Bacillus infantis]MCP1157603.1 response regulator transcription factor [Bacillus infantis]MDW2877497.1 response regulator transcription factor [Bacillus infantis]RYI32552.1 response regulator transcription factor [Bacillus infantis]